MNPEKMRGEYGKLMYLLQDAVSLELQEFRNPAIWRQSRAHLRDLTGSKPHYSTQLYVRQTRFNNWARSKISSVTRHDELNFVNLQRLSADVPDLALCNWQCPSHLEYAPTQVQGELKVARAHRLLSFRRLYEAAVLNLLASHFARFLLLK
ncbi:hypothetical protein DD238_006440 [Peronospora effusa]|uniref:Non-canonical E2 ubiquitin-conjugating enzyme C-terminal domain-containing protein n=1 Tax=Peronospora effusa TaxID=542832 RepID=A0A3M6V8J7_9STRA|nr:hypothetical protein DD238_006440 [Peronospora effusa]